MRLRLHPDKEKNIIAYYLYAGGAFSYAFPNLSFGLRDIDVEVLFDNSWKTNTRCAFTRPSNITELGEDDYFLGKKVEGFNKTRWIDLMWNSIHQPSTGDPDKDLIIYLNEMRFKSDRWATASQRPFVNLETKRVVYIPRWLNILLSYMKR